MYKFLFFGNIKINKKNFNLKMKMNIGLQVVLTFILWDTKWIKIGKSWVCVFICNEANWIFQNFITNKIESIILITSMSYKAL